MTVSTETNHNEYTGNDVTTSFPYTFRIFKKSDLVVFTSANDGEDIKILRVDTDYTVTSVGGFRGGNVVLKAPLSSGVKISISRELPATQETSLRNQGKFFPEVHEDAFDKLTMLIQQVRSSFSLALRKPSFLANYYDAVGNYIRNLRDPSRPQDAATKSYVDNQIVGNTENWKNADKKSLRVSDVDLHVLPPAQERAEKVLSFDRNGQPIAVAPASGSAADVLNQLASPPGAGLIGTRSGLTVQELLERAHLFAVDFLPKGYVLDGSVSYAKELQAAIFEAAAQQAILIMPPFYCVVDPEGTAYGGLIVPSNSDIAFLPQSELAIKSNDLPGYELLSIRDVRNVRIYRPKLRGDKYTHTGSSGEWGVGIAIRGACQNITIVEPETNEFWGDGIYVGQTSDTKESTPENVRIINPKALRNRRQGISITSAKNLTIDMPKLSYTKSSDSPTLLPDGPHAGIDIEPNSFNSTLENIVINNLSGEANDAGLFYVFLGGCEKDAPQGGTYHVDIKVNGITDDGSTAAIYLMGASKNISYSGAIYINNVVSKNAKRNGIRCRSWPADSIHVFIDGFSITDWHKYKTATAAIDTAPVSIYQNTDTNFGDIGGIDIRKLSLTNKSSENDISENIVFTSNAGGGIDNVNVELVKCDINQSPLFVQSQAGAIKFKNLEFGKGITQHRAGSWTQSIGLITDIIVDKPLTQPTLTLPVVPNSSFAGYKFRVRLIPGGALTFRIRQGSVPLIFNGVKGSNFLVDSEAGVVEIEYDGQCFYAKSPGPVIRES